MALGKNKTSEPNVEASDLAKGFVVLTQAIWALLEQQAQAENRTTSYVIRKILGKHYRLDVSLSNPRAKKKGPEGRRA